MAPIFKYESASIAISELKTKGYLQDFNLIENELHKNFDRTMIDIVYRYEGDTNPDDQSIVYGIDYNGIKGIFVSGYSPDSNDELSILLWKKAAIK
nr:hypothetical protein [uncultured Flavobacterium sp.]